VQINLQKTILPKELFSIDLNQKYDNPNKINYLLLIVVESSVEVVGPNPEPVIQSDSSSSHAPGMSVINEGGGTTVGGT
jgi:hypothetical protein